MADNRPTYTPPSFGTENENSNKTYNDELNNTYDEMSDSYNYDSRPEVKPYSIKRVNEPHNGNHQIRFSRRNLLSWMLIALVIIALLKSNFILGALSTLFTIVLTIILSIGILAGMFYLLSAIVLGRAPRIDGLFRGFRGGRRGRGPWRWF